MSGKKRRCRGMQSTKRRRYIVLSLVLNFQTIQQYIYSLKLIRSRTTTKLVLIFVCEISP